MTDTAKSGAEAGLYKVRDHIVRTALAVSGLTALMLIGGMLGTKLGLIDWKLGFGTMTIGLGAPAAFTSLIVGLCALYCAVVTPKGTKRLALAALIVPVLAIGGLGALRGAAGKVPPIHDISTDRIDPPSFSESVVKARGPDANSVDLLNKFVPDGASPDFAGKRSLDLQAEAYPQIKTRSTSGAMADVEGKVREAMKAAGIAVTPGDTPGRVEGVATSALYGFKDDVVVRIRPDPDDASGARLLVDIRSTSRVGMSDLGANAKRIDLINAELDKRLAP
jgi:hypothetical protein